MENSLKNLFVVASQFHALQIVPISCYLDGMSSTKDFRLLISTFLFSLLFFKPKDFQQIETNFYIGTSFSSQMYIKVILKEKNMKIYMRILEQYSKTI